MVVAVLSGNLALPLAILVSIWSEESAGIVTVTDAAPVASSLQIEMF